MYRDEEEEDRRKKGKRMTSKISFTESNNKKEGTDKAEKRTSVF